MQKDQQQLAEFIKGKKVAFIGAGVSHKTLIGQFCAMGAQVTLCDKKQLADFGEYADTLNQLGVALSLGEDYLNGLTFPAEGEKGWYLICADGCSLGWGKLAGGIMKNHYPKGLRKNW